MEILAIIPARGGSKGVYRKNIRELNKIPLIAYSIIEANKSEFITRVVVSTEDLEIAEISKKYGGEIPCFRPMALAADNSSTIDGILHMVEYLKVKENYIPDYIVVLQCTSPLRKSRHIDEAIKKLVSSDFDGIISICEAEVNPYWTNVLKNGKLEYFIEEGKKISKRQDLPKIYRYNGAIFIAKIEALIKEKTFEVKNLTGYVMEADYSVDIDTELDFRLAETIVKLKKEDL